MGAEDVGRPARGDAGAGEAAVAVLLGAGALAWRVADRVTAPARWLVGGIARPIAGALVGPVAAGPTAAQGRALRAQWAVLLARTAGHVAREVVAVVLPALDLTTLVLKHVDLDRIAAALDLDAAVARVDLDAAVARVDLEAAVARVDIGAIVDRIDLDAIVARVALDAIVERIDLDALVARVDIGAIVDRVDVDGIVARVDLDAVVARVDIGAIVDRIDLDAVAARIDIEAIAARLDLDRLAAGLDVTAVVDRVDLDAVAARVDADRVVARVDLDAVVARLDLVGIAQSVIDAIDLPEIVRESTGALSSDAVRAVRAESRRADDRVAGLFDRLLRRTPYPDGPPAGAPALP
ncbi:MAG TPA: hypothetical protein VHS35_24470 [Pseudonocardia sp.]|nr:hypothetical protein [Pseudonocardia sp.]